ncbi:CPBP family intramembrane glutamic endopeptidase [Flavobacterium reichenbachii]|uniref:CPBP family intramembrane glutamic endopeptidase n=1 Tax=Flavobacterium reichenbachii TaxID=362418 RepID=UPI0013F43F34|nr:CPBP family intramembrane glutamic endopeptidase [Flavobacterium reichenbachii]
MKVSLKHSNDFLVGFFWPIFYWCLYEFIVAEIVENPYQINASFTANNFSDTFLFLLRSVLFEELIFRGAFFCLICYKLSINYAIIISTISFGIYHWFSWELFGNPTAMIVVFLMTGCMGFIFAYTLVRSGSVYISTALHLSGNLTNILIFSKDYSLGKQWLVKSFADDPFLPNPWISISIIILHYTGYQFFTFLLLKWYLAKRPGLDSLFKSHDQSN